MSRSRSRFCPYAGWAAWAEFRYGSTAIGTPMAGARLRLDRLDVEEAEALWGGDDAYVPVPFLCCGDQLADLGGDSGRADDDLEERLVGLVTHAGTPSWRLKWCGSGSAWRRSRAAMGATGSRTAGRWMAWAAQLSAMCRAW